MFAACIQSVNIHSIIIDEDSKEALQDSESAGDAIDPFEYSNDFLDPIVVRKVQREANDAVTFLKTRQMFWSQYINSTFSSHSKPKFY